MPRCNSYLKFLAELTDLKKEQKPKKHFPASIPFSRGGGKKKYIHTHPCLFGTLGIKIKYFKRKLHIFGSRHFGTVLEGLSKVVALNKQQLTIQSIKFLGALIKEEFVHSSQSKRFFKKQNKNCHFIAIRVKSTFGKRKTTNRNRNTHANPPNKVYF